MASASPSASASASPPIIKASPVSLLPPSFTTPATWSHLETLHLIDAYQSKWYSLNRGQLKAHQWEEVAASVADRSPSDAPTKTATQCRHKIEKLRKRYRAEKLRPSFSSSSWPFLHRMDLLEHGPSSTLSDDDPPAGATTRSLNNILRRPPPPPILSLIDKSFPRFSRSPRFRKRASFAACAAAAGCPDDEDDDDSGDDPISELATVVRSFGEGFVRIEKMKMDMMREVEKNRMEMEMKKTQMILKSQQRIADALSAALGSSSQKKPKHSEDSPN